MLTLSQKQKQLRSAVLTILYYEATTNPTATDDRNKRFVRGSRWINKSTSHEYVCLSNEPNNAVWKTTTASGGGGGGGQDPVSSTSAPTASDDTSEGHEVGRIWVNTTDDSIYIAADVTEDAAVWVVVSGSGGCCPADEVAADEDPLLDGTTVQAQLTSVSNLLQALSIQTAFAFTYLPAINYGFADIIDIPDPEVVVGYTTTSI